MFDQLLANLHKNSYSNDISVFQSLDVLLNMHFEEITCFEVLEHLDKNGQKSALQNIKRMLRKDGVILISIPIEIGLSSLIKNGLRIITRQSHDAANLRNIIKSFLGLAVVRKASPYISSHIGFDFRDLESVFLEEGLLN